MGGDITRHDADSLIKALQTAKPGVERIELLLTLARFHLFKAGELKKDLDSATALIEEARRENITLKAGEDGFVLLLDSYVAWEYQDRAKARLLLDKAIVLLNKGNNYFMRGKAYIALADYYDMQNPAEVADRMRAFQAAIAAFKAGGLIEQEADTYQRLGETDSSDVTTEVSLRKALALYESIHFRETQGAYNLLAGVFIFRGNFPEALKYDLKALTIAEAVGDTTLQLCTINNHIAIIYQHNHDTANAVKYYSEALRIAEKYNDKGTVYLLTHNIASIYFSMRNAVRARELLESVQHKYGPPDKKDAVTNQRFVTDLLRLYTLTRQFDRAAPYSRELIDIESSFARNYEVLSDIYVYLLEYFLASGQYSRMPVYLKKDEAAATGYGSPRNLLTFHLLWFSYDSAVHDYKGAVEQLLAVTQWRNVINSNVRDRALKQLQVQYETQKKEDEITALHRQTKLEKANARQAMVIKNISVAGIIAVIIIAILLFRQNRLKQRNNNLVTRQNEKLQHLVSEKEWLLKELHHRVKNNLQIVMSLLESQSEFIDNEPALAAIHNSEHRIHAMSLIHQKLYNTDNVATINMALYIRELGSYLADSFNTGQQIRITYDVQDIELDVSQAVPLGLIMNEAITNAMKYAFPDSRRGVISISFTAAGPHHYLLCIGDNGIGFPAASINKKRGSLGMTLMEGLTGDLNGSFSVDSGNGTTIRILFPSGQPAARQNEMAQLPDKQPYTFLAEK